ncbi:MAG: hypothetical protein LBC20_08105, partial [Planctomycetaceae bacterium]|nr:hypothetical protein [Planctomycetaceae bacterium]
MTDDDTLNFDFQTYGITVENASNSTTGLTAGFGYLSSVPFSGTLKADSSSTATFSVSAAG